MNENALLITINNSGKDIVNERFQMAQIIYEHYGNDVVINHGVDSLLVLWKSQMLTKDLIDKVASLPVQLSTNEIVKGTSWSLPIYYDRNAPDMIDVSHKLSLSVDAVIQLHKEVVYTVSFIGFLPGFPYLTGLNKQLHIDRKAIPVLKVAKGSVAIAAGMCGMYPQESPGGWYILGNCPVPLFDKERTAPFLLKTMDSLTFYEIDAPTFYKLQKDSHRMDLNQFKNG